MIVGSGRPLAPLGALALFMAPLLLAAPEFFTAGAVKMYLLELLFFGSITALAALTAWRSTN